MPDADALVFARLLFAGYEGGLVEVAGAVRRGGELSFRSRQAPWRYLPASRPEEVAHLARRLMARSEEVFVGPVPRREPLARSEVVGESLVVWADLDDPDAVARARTFARPAHIVVSSGSGLHLYWKVTERLSPEEAETANRRLARHLGADVAATDRLRLLRVPGSENAKAGRRAALLRARGGLPAYRLCDLLAGVADLAPAPARAERGRRAGPLPGTGTPREWFVALAGVEPDALGFVSCPLPDHDDPHPSCRVYETPERGWWCFGCARGGGVVDLASLLEGGPWGRELRGAAFRSASAAVKRHLAPGVGDGHDEGRRSGLRLVHPAATRAGCESVAPLRQGGRDGPGRDPACGVPGRCT